MPPFVPLASPLCNGPSGLGDVFFATYVAFKNFEQNHGWKKVRLITHRETGPELWMFGLAMASINPSEQLADPGGVSCFSQLLLGVCLRTRLDFAVCA